MSDFDFWSDANLHGNKLKAAIIGGKAAFETPDIGSLASENGVLYIYDGNDRTGTYGWTALGSTSTVDAVANRVTTLEGKMTTAEGKITTAEGDIDALEGRMDTAEGDIDALETAIGADDTADTVKGRIKTLETTVGGATSGLVQQVNTNTTDIGTNKTDISGLKTRVTTIETDYAPKDTTGLVNYYTKTEVDGKVAGAFHFKGSIAKIADITGIPVEGDVWNITTGGETDRHGTVIKAGDNVAWSVIGGVGGWDVLAGTMDLAAYYTSAQVDNLLDYKVNTVADAALLANTDKAKYDGYDARITANTTAIGDAQTDGTILKRLANNDVAISNLQSGKVDKITGKGLSTNDYTTTEKEKLADIAEGAQVNVIETVKVNNSALTPDANKAVDITVPTTTSQLTNNSGFITKAVNDLDNYYTKSNVYTQAAINACFATANITTVASGDDFVAEVTVSGTPIMAQMLDAAGNVVIAAIKIETNKVTVTTSASRTGKLNIIIPASAAVDVTPSGN